MTNNTKIFNNMDEEIDGLEGVYFEARKKAEEKVKLIFQSTKIDEWLKKNRGITFALIQTKLKPVAERMFLNEYLTEGYCLRLEQIQKLRYKLGAKVGYLKASFKPWELGNDWKSYWTEDVEKYWDDFQVEKRGFREISLLSRKVCLFLEKLINSFLVIINILYLWSLKAGIATITFLTLLDFMKLFLGVKKKGISFHSFDTPLIISILSSVAVIQLLSLAVFNWYSNTLSYKQTRNIQQKLEVLEDQDVEIDEQSFKDEKPNKENWIKLLFKRFFSKTTHEKYNVSGLVSSSHAEDLESEQITDSNDTVSNVIPISPLASSSDFGKSNTSISINLGQTDTVVKIEAENNTVVKKKIIVAQSNNYKSTSQVFGFTKENLRLLFFIWFTEALLGYALITSANKFSGPPIGADMGQLLLWLIIQLSIFFGISTFVFVNLFFAISQAVKHVALVEKRSELFALIEKCRNLDRQIKFCRHKIEESQSAFKHYEKEYLDLLQEEGGILMQISTLSSYAYTGRDGVIPLENQAG